MLEKSLRSEGSNLKRWRGIFRFFLPLEEFQRSSFFIAAKHHIKEGEPSFSERMLGQFSPFKRNL